MSLAEILVEQNPKEGVNSGYEQINTALKGLQRFLTLEFFIEGCGVV